MDTREHLATPNRVRSILSHTSDLLSHEILLTHSSSIASGLSQNPIKSTLLLHLALQLQRSKKWITNPLSLPLYLALRLELEPDLRLPRLLERNPLLPPPQIAPNPLHLLILSLLHLVQNLDLPVKPLFKTMKMIISTILSISITMHYKLKLNLK